MSDLAEKIKEQAAQLSLQERADIAQFLLHSLEPDIANGVSDTDLDAMLLRRSEDLKQGKVKGIPAEEALARLREKIK